MPAYHSVSHNAAIDVMVNAEIMIGRYSVTETIGFIVCPCNMITKYLFIISNNIHTIGVDKITLFKTT